MKFNSSKSKLLFFKSPTSHKFNFTVSVNGDSVKLVEEAVHIGHVISTSDKK